MKVITFDTETTGLLADPTARIIEFGAVRHDLETGEMMSSYSAMCLPPVELLDDSKFELAQRISGITRDEITSAKPYKEVVGDFMNWVGKDLVYAWNLPFDQRMLQRYFLDVMTEPGLTASPFWQEQARKWMEQIRWGGCWQHLYAYMHIDRAGKWDDGNLKTISMRRAMQYEGMTGEQTHRALDDAHLAAHMGHLIYQKLK
jgi:DNA polymerase III epsilon subunit-like protein